MSARYHEREPRSQTGDFVPAPRPSDGGRAADLPGRGLTAGGHWSSSNSNGTQYVCGYARQNLGALYCFQQ